MVRYLAMFFPLLLLAPAALPGCSGAGPAQLAEPAELLYEGEGSGQAGGADSASETAGAPPGKAGSKTVTMRAYRFGLQQAIEWALAHNLSLMTSRDQVARAGFNVRTAAAAFEVKITPRADASLSGGSGSSDTSRGAGIELSKKTLLGTQIGVSGDTDRSDDTHTTGLALSLTQPLLRGLGRTLNEESLLYAKFGLISIERSFVEYQENLVVSVVRGFYEIIRQREFLALNEKSAERTRRHVKAAVARERVGLASRIDVLRAKIQLRQAEDTLLSARRAYGNAIDSFRILLGFGPQDNVQIDADLSYEEFDIGEETATIMAINNRLDLARARDNITQARRDLRVARNNTLPQLDLVFGYQQYGSGNSFSDSSDMGESLWTIGLSTSTDIRRTAERARYEQAKLDLAAAGRNYELQEDTVVREVKDALRKLEMNRKRIAIQKADVEQARQKLKLAKMKFDRGLADNFDLIDAEEEVIRAETNQVSAVTDYIVSQVEVKKAIGTLIKRARHLLK